MATVYERVRKIVVDQLGVDEEQVVPAASFVDDLNADSLDLVELIMSLEEEFSKDGKALEISDEDAEKIVTVQDAIDLPQRPRHRRQLDATQHDAQRSQAARLALCCSRLAISGRPCGVSMFGVICLRSFWFDDAGHGSGMQGS